MIHVEILPTEPSAFGLSLGLPDSCRNDGDIIMFCHLMISSIQCGRIQSLFEGFTAVEQLSGTSIGVNAAEKFKHLDMRFDPVICLLVQVCLYKGILAVSKGHLQRSLPL